ncbi:hypothetical protein ACVWU4_000909 [Campylobacter coli]
MAKIQGGVPVAGFISPTDSDDVFPVTDPKYQKGGYRVVATVDEMNKITTERREEGMLVYVLQDDTKDPASPSTYRLVNSVFVKEEVDLSGLDNMVTTDELTELLKDYYTKIETDELLKNFDVDLTDYYNKTEIDELLANFTPEFNPDDVNIDLSDYYTKDKLYNKEEIDKMVSGITPDLKPIESQVQAANNKVNAIDAEVDNLKPSIENNTNKIEDLQNQIDSLDTDLNVDNNTLYFTPDDVLTARTASDTNLGMIKTDNVDTWVDGGVLKIKKVEPDNTSIEYDTAGKLALAGDIKKQIAEMQEQIDNINMGIQPDQFKLPVATSTRLGISRPDGTSIVVVNGVLSTNIPIPEATPVSKGIVKADEKSLTINNGVMSLKRQITRLLDLDDVSITKLEGHDGKVLTVEKEKIVLKAPGQSIVKSLEKSIANTDYELLYDLSKVSAVASQAMLKVVNNDASSISIKYKGKVGNSYTGEEYTEEVSYSITRLFPVLELNMEIYIKGNCKVVLAITSHGG